MRTLSKSKLIAFRQCPKRLWLEVHSPTLRADSAATQASFASGHAIGDIARALYDPYGRGALIDVAGEGFDAALKRSQTLLDHTAQPVFEAGFRAAGAIAFADVMLPCKGRSGRGRQWRMVEVKSSTSVKDYQRDDAAIQAFVAQEAGVKLAQIAIAHVNAEWVYPGGDDYRGLLLEHDVTEDAFARREEVRQWLADAQTVVAKRKAPALTTGAHCESPFACGFIGHCRSSEAQATHPVQWLPRPTGKLRAHIDAHAVTEMADVPDALLNEQQRRVKQATLTARTIFDQKAARAALSPHRLPSYFLDFETISYVIPRWAGTRPYEQIPFQFSLHRLSRTGKLQAAGFLDLSGGDPRESFTQTLLAACGERGPIFVYNAGFESARIGALAQRFPRAAPALEALRERLVDLLPIAREHYYHPGQQGSWSIKAVLPALCPDLDYGDLDGVQDGGAAMNAYLEATHPATTPDRKAEIERQLRAYCALDTYGLARLWAAFTGSTITD